DTGEARIWLLDGAGNVTEDKGIKAPDEGWKVIGVADFNGDGKADLLWRRQDDTGEARIWFLDGAGNVTEDKGLKAPDEGWKVIGVADFNGDGEADLLWRRQDDTAEARVWLLDGAGALIQDVGLPAPAAV